MAGFSQNRREAHHGLWEQRKGFAFPSSGKKGTRRQSGIKARAVLKGVGEGSRQELILMDHHPYVRRRTAEQNPNTGNGVAQRYADLRQPPAVIATKVAAWSSGKKKEGEKTEESVQKKPNQDFFFFCTILSHLKEEDGDGTNRVAGAESRE